MNPRQAQRIVRMEADVANGIAQTQWRELSDEYTASFLTPTWHMLKALRMLWARGRCERCHNAARYYHGHHKDYKTIEKQTLLDVRKIEILCPDCHRIADIERKRKVRA